LRALPATRPASSKAAQNLGTSLSADALAASSGVARDQLAGIGGGKFLLRRLPAKYHWPELAEEGGFAAYGPRLTSGEFPEREARLIVKLLRGIKPADLPIEQPTKFELVINLKTANALGITVPAALLARADKVIE
jgi:ABC transporter substrate binding protein